MSEPMAWIDSQDGSLWRDKINDNDIPFYLHPDPRVAELEAVLRECREALVPYMKYVDGTNVLNWLFG